MDAAKNKIQSFELPVKPHSRFRDLSGRKYGRLTLIKCLGKNLSHPDRRDYWYECQCECGLIAQVSQTCMVNGNTLSCGCIRKEKVRIAAKEYHRRRSLISQIEPFDSRKSEYKTWMGMKNRCSNAGINGYSDYGGRGIKVCDRWLHSFKSFLADMGNKPTPKHTIERKDNDGDYEPSNCIWGTAIEQANNKRNNHRITHNGETLTMAQWSKKSGVKYWTLADRIYRGFPFAKCITLGDFRLPSTQIQ